MLRSLYAVHIVKIFFTEQDDTIRMSDMLERYYNWPEALFGKVDGRRKAPALWMGRVGGPGKTCQRQRTGGLELF